MTAPDDNLVKPMAINSVRPTDCSIHGLALIGGPEDSAVIGRRQQPSVAKLDEPERISE